jgi:hypothetical protein
MATAEGVYRDAFTRRLHVDAAAGIGWLFAAIALAPAPDGGPPQLRIVSRSPRRF